VKASTTQWRNRRKHLSGGIVFHSGLTCILIFCLCTGGILFASQEPARTDEDAQPKETPRLTAALNTDTAPIGGLIELSLVFDLPRGAKLTTPPQIKGLEELTVVDHREAADRITMRLLVDRLDSWKTGSLSLAYIDAQNKPQTLTTGPVSVTVESVLGEKPQEARLKPIREIIPITPVWFKYWPWMAGAMAVLFTGLGLFWWLLRRRRKERLAQMEVPPHIRATKHIQRLEAQGLFERGKIKAFYFRLSEILRQYLETLRRFPAAEFTTEEIASHITHEQDRQLLDLLRQADLVKFAADIPSTAKKDDQVRTALSYIRETTPMTVADKQPAKTGDPAP